MRKKWGDKIAKKLQQRLMELKAAESLKDISHLPPARCHGLEGQQKGQFAVDLTENYRLIFKPDHDPLPETVDGGLDKTKVTRIIILEVSDYHCR